MRNFLISAAVLIFVSMSDQLYADTLLEPAFVSKLEYDVSGNLLLSLITYREGLVFPTASPGQDLIDDCDGSYYTLASNEPLREAVYYLLEMAKVSEKKVMLDFNGSTCAITSVEIVE